MNVMLGILEYMLLANVPRRTEVGLPVLVLEKKKNHRVSCYKNLPFLKIKQAHAAIANCHSCSKNFSTTQEGS